MAAAAMIRQPAGPQLRETVLLPQVSPPAVQNAVPNASVSKTEAAPIAHTAEPTQVEEPEQTALPMPQQIPWRIAGELFDSLSVRMEDGSPFKTTLLLGYCYHHINYLPSMAAFKYGSYEVDTTRFKPGTGEEVADTYVQMLKELKEQ